MHKYNTIFKILNVDTYNRHLNAKAVQTKTVTRTTTEVEIRGLKMGTQCSVRNMLQENYNHILQANKNILFCMYLYRIYQKYTLYTLLYIYILYVRQ